MDLKDGGLVKDFELERARYESFAATVSGLLERLLKAEEIGVHSISFRCKEVTSLEKKITAKPSYPSLAHITDLAGVRVITHYSDDVDRVAVLVESEFSIDAENSIDKRVALDPDRFGYLSLHYVASMNPERSKLKEYSAFRGLKVEIQVRSILQHTWAEIEHDIGYKSTVQVPRHIRRKFSRLAGLLELADQEFVSIRTDLDAYESSIEGKESTEEALLDKVTYTSYVSNDSDCRNLDKVIAESCRYKLVEIIETEKCLAVCALLEIPTLGVLSQQLNDNRAAIILRAKKVAESRAGLPLADIGRGVCVFLLHQVIVAKSQDLELAKAYCALNDWSEEFVTYLMEFGADLNSRKST
jgi:ppGpp synthetase/RelA/SpoT-type nucleotidyltranferase